MSAGGRRGEAVRRTSPRPRAPAPAVSVCAPGSPARQTHLAILGGIVILFVLCEIAGWAEVAPSVLREGLVDLHFLAPAMLGIFVSQVLLRPGRKELLASVGLAAALAYPLYAAVASEELAVAKAIFNALGLGTILVLGFAALRSRRGSPARDAALEALLPALILAGFVLLTRTVLHLTALLWPTTYDHHLYLADAAFGAPLSFEIARLVGRIPLAFPICLAVYVTLPLALMVVHALRIKQRSLSSDTLVAFVAISVVGFVGFLIVPVAGPRYVFGELFPMQPPDPASITATKILAAPLPRNCMPSLHTAWALLIWWNARPLHRWFRLAAALFVGITLLATVALGFHYVVDLVAAFPLTLAVHAWASRVSEARTRRDTMLAGVVLTGAWMALATWGLPLWQGSPVPCWILALLVIGLSSALERRLFGASLEEVPIPAMPPRRLSRSARCAAALLVFFGIAGSIHLLTVANAFDLTFAVTPHTRTLALALTLGGVALGHWLGGRQAWGHAPLRAIAWTAAAAAFYSWSSPVLWRALGRGYAALIPGSGAEPVLPLLQLAVEAVAVVPSALALGLMPPLFVRHLSADSRALGSTIGLVVALGALGASLGAIGTAYLVRPALDALAVVGFINLVVALVAAALAARGRTPTGRDSERPRSGDASTVSTPPERAARSALIVLGFLALSLGIIHLHLLTVVIGDSGYALPCIWFTVLLGFAGGAAAARLRLKKSEDPSFDLLIFPGALAFAVLLTGSLWEKLPGYFASFASYIERYHMATTFAEQELVRLWVCCVTSLPPMLCIGYLFVLLTACVARQEPVHRVRAFGRASAVCLVGSLVAVPVTGFALLPAFGSRLTLEITAAVTMVLPAIALPVSPRRWRVLGGTVTAAALAAILLTPNRFDMSKLATGAGAYFAPQAHGEAIDARESLADGLATVHASATGGAALAVYADGQWQAGSGSAGELRVQAAYVLSALLHSTQRERALVIGVANGLTPRMLRDAGFGQVVVAEPNGDLIALVRRYFTGVHDRALDDPVVSIHGRDARSVLRRQSTAFDLISIQAPNLWAARNATLYHRELYELARSRMTPRAVFQQWLPLHHVSPLEITAVLAAVRSSFDAVWLYVFGDQGIVVACAADCAPAAELQSTPALQQTLQSLDADLTTSEAARLLDPAASERLLHDVAARAGVPSAALSSTDRNLLLEYYAPRGNLLPYETSLQENLDFLRRFAAR